MTAYNLDTCAVLVELSISLWTARKLDRTVTDEVVANKSAKARDAARVNKSLLAGRPELAKIQQHVTDARQYLYEQTMPWSDSGLRLLPAANLLKFSERMGMYEEDFDKMVDDFIAMYPTLITAQAMALGDMFKRDDFPTQDSLKHKFGFRMNVLPVPAAGDFRVDVGLDAQRELQERLEQLAQERVQRAVDDVKARLGDHLKRMSDRLTTDVVDGEVKPRRFTSSLVEGAYDLCDLIKALNVTRDPDLEAARASLERALGTKNADDLRDNDTARADVKVKVDSILEKFRW